VAPRPEPRPAGAGFGRPAPPLRVAALIAAAVVALAFVAAFVLDGRGTSFGYDSPFNRFPANPAGTGSTVKGAPDPQRQPLQFLSAVSTDIQGFWKQEFARSGLAYAPAEIVVFRRATQSTCGLASAATGPFYCPLDHSVYLDPGFFRELAVRFKAPGDFADAYVVAHELGHHVQTLTGITRQVDQARARELQLNNALSISLELQADCLAGVWAHSTYDRGLITTSDVAEALRAAAAVGDDRIQARTVGRIDPETWTHGSSEQR
jgi:predicted metalloprotease